MLLGFTFCCPALLELAEDRDAVADGDRVWLMNVPLGPKAAEAAAADPGELPSRTGCCCRAAVSGGMCTARESASPSVSAESLLSVDTALCQDSKLDTEPLQQ